MAIEMGVVDKVLPPEKIALEVEKEAQRMFKRCAVREMKKNG